MPTKDYWQARSITPMLIGREATLEKLHAELDFNEYITELKFDGFRTLAYLDPATGTELRTRRNNLLLPQFPELAGLHDSVKARCIVDGELLVFQNGQQSFAEVSRRSRLKNPYAIQTAASEAPASFVAFDILYLKNHSTIQSPQLERSALLRNTVKAKGEITLSEYHDGPPDKIYRFAETRHLEGIVLKHKAATYQPGYRTKEWVKVKILLDDDFVICGYIPSTKLDVVTLILGQYAGGKLQRMGRVVLGTARSAWAQVQAVPIGPPPFPPAKKEAGAVWLQPQLVCTVQFTQRSTTGTMRHPVFKALRPDKSPAECVAPHS